jgi:cell division septation protein DedD
MNRVSIYQIPVAADVLQSAVAAPSIPPALVQPMQAMVAAIAHRVSEVPLCIYVCAEDELAAARDGFATVLAKSLAAHVPSTLLVDCDFLKIGMHGLVPQPDALGFLDFLLYGSSIGVVTQDAASGVRVVGAGSFPVTKRMPFVAHAFEEAARRLASHARCVVFAGPAVLEDGHVHPLASECDITIFVRGEEIARRPRAAAEAGAMEEAVAGNGVEVWSVRVGAQAHPPRLEPPVSAPKAPEPAATAKPKTEPVPSARPAAPQRAATPSRPPVNPPPRRPAASPPPASLDVPETRYGSLIPRIAVIVFALLVIGFVAWWMWQGRGKGEPDTAQTDTSRPVSLPIDTIPHSATDTARTIIDTTAAPVHQTEPAPVGDAPAPTSTAAGNFVRPDDTGGRSGGKALANPEDILVMADLEQRWNGWFAIHVSSFQESVRAREEVSFLQSREFPVFIVFLDLGAKGKWYRVYAGPFETREEARDVKKNLDAIPQVRFTRITKIPE